MTTSFAKLLPASTLRVAILEAFHGTWEKRPGAQDNFPVQQIWDGIYARFGKRVDGPLVQGTFNGLLDEQLLECVQAADGTVAGRITGKGRTYLHDRKEANTVRLIAYLGATTGSLSLLWDIVSKLVRP